MIVTAQYILQQESYTETFTPHHNTTVARIGSVIFSLDCQHKRHHSILETPKVS